MGWKTKEQAKAYNDKYRAQNAERIKAQKRAKYAEDPVKYRKARADWRLANPSRALQTDHSLQSQERSPPSHGSSTGPERTGYPRTVRYESGRCSS